MKESLRNAKEMVSYYQEEIKKNERKEELFIIADEMEEAKRVRSTIEHYRSQMEHQANYVRAIEFYLKNH